MRNAAMTAKERAEQLVGKLTYQSARPCCSLMPRFQQYPPAVGSWHRLALINQVTGLLPVWDCPSGQAGQITSPLPCSPGATDGDHSDPTLRNAGSITSTPRLQAADNPGCAWECGNGGGMLMEDSGYHDYATAQIRPGGGAPADRPDSAIASTAR